jgi:hypothetical protein
MAVGYGDSHRHPSIQSSRGGHKQVGAPMAGIRPKKGKAAGVVPGKAAKLPGMGGTAIPDGDLDDGMGSGGKKAKNPQK